MAAAENGAFLGIVDDPLGERTVKPRRDGVTMVIDKGMGVQATEGLLAIAASYIDYWKLPFGTSAVYPPEILRRKIHTIRAAGVSAYPGGTFLEIAHLQGHLEAFVERVVDLGFDAIEVSDGTIDLTPSERREAIRIARANGLTVLTEVGRKDPTERLSALQIHRTMLEDIAAGAERIIVEGRESGKGVGIYDEQGEIAEEELLKMVRAAGDTHRLIWEAPLKSQQQELIRRFGSNVSLGNVPPEEILALEALRRGLRADTLRYVLPGRAEGGV
ncbi:MAG: phosphosulfolactate synthase [Thermaerobacter sp.]|nr:phosphosulfolactate synthase [Thermaerobacter sp.]